MIIQRAKAPQDCAQDSFCFHDNTESKQEIQSHLTPHTITCRHLTQAKRTITCRHLTQAKQSLLPKATYDSARTGSRTAGGTGWGNVCFVCQKLLSLMVRSVMLIQHTFCQIQLIARHGPLSCPFCVCALKTPVLVHVVLDSGVSSCSPGLWC